MTSASPAIDRDSFLSPFTALGFQPSEPGLLFPADLFIDLSGEELGKRLFLTSDDEGRDLCLRPEFTIPVCIDHIAGGAPARCADYAYFGRVFRKRSGASGEFWQGGVEAIGGEDRAAEDARLLALAIETASRHGVRRPVVRLGDVALFRAVLEALDLPASWRRRLARDFGRSSLAEAGIERLSQAAPSTRHSGLMATLERANPEQARALVADLLSLGGLSPAGGRGVEEIAERFLERAESLAAASAPPADLALLKRFLSLEGPPLTMLDEARRLLTPLGAALLPAFEDFERRCTAFANAGLDLSTMVFSSAFGRRLDYYSGLVFELHERPTQQEPPLVGGGRYDQLFTVLGARQPVPAIGFSVFIERLAGSNGEAPG